MARKEIKFIVNGNDDVKKFTKAIQKVAPGTAVFYSGGSTSSRPSIRVEADDDAHLEKIKSTAKSVGVKTPAEAGTFKPSTGTGSGRGAGMGGGQGGRAKTGTSGGRGKGKSGGGGGGCGAGSPGGGGFAKGNTCQASNTQALYLSCACHDKAVQKSPLAFRKEIVYVGEFKSQKMPEPFVVTEDLIDHWVAEFSVMKSFGFKAKLPVEHTFDPEKNRGHVVGLHKGYNSQGKVALFANIMFNDLESAKLANSTDVSIYSPPTYLMGNGYNAVRPITHVALTDYPVVPGLQPFETLAASNAGGDQMLKDLAVKLGLTVPDGADDAAITEMIIKAFTALKPATPPPGGAPATPPVAASNDLVVENRSLKIDSLVNDRKLAPAEATAWKKMYAVAITLSTTDGFDSAYTLALARAPIFEPGSKTGKQTYSEETNPLLEDARARQKAASGK
jgi:hypothetical protein